MGDGEERFSLGLDVIVNGLIETPTEGRLTPWPGSRSDERAVVRRQRRRRGLGEQGRVRRAHPLRSRPTTASRTSASPSRSSSPASPAACTTPRRPRRGSSCSPASACGDRGPGAPAAPVGLLPLPAGNPPRPRRRRRRPVHSAHGRRPAQRVAVGDPLSARTPSRRATAPRSPRRRAPPSRPTPTARTPVRVSAHRGPTPDARCLTVRDRVPRRRPGVARAFGEAAGDRKERLRCRAIRRAQSRTVAASRRRRRATARPSACARKQVRRAMIAGTVGTSIEWYDFFLYGTAAALVFPKLFFPGASAYAGALAVVRDLRGRLRRAPGRRGDLRPLRRPHRPQGDPDLDPDADGHRQLPDRRAARLRHARLLGADAAGRPAPVQGIGVGGEWGGSVTLCMEWGNPKRRGFIGSWPQVGVPIGLLLSTGAVSLLTHTMGGSFETWGWRLPFLFSIVLVGVGLWVRLGVLESPLFRARSRRTRSRSAARWRSQARAARDRPQRSAADGRAGAVLHLHRLRARLRHGRRSGSGTAADTR